MNIGLDRYIDNVQHLPPSPSSLVNILNEFRNPDQDIDKIVHMMSHDPALTAEILKCCNSACYGMDERTDDMFLAVSQLGFYEAYRIVVAMLGAHAMKAGEGDNTGLVAAVWRHSVLTAVIAGVVAGELGESQSDGFTVGLLHDVGKVVLGGAEGRRYLELQNSALLTARPVFEVERETFGFDHAALGGRLLERWNLPSAVVTAVACHHDFGSSSEFQRLTAIVALANALAKQFDAGALEDTEHIPGCSVPMGVLQESPARLSNWIDQSRESFDRVKDMLLVHGEN